MIYRIIEILGNRNAGFILCMIVIINLIVDFLYYVVDPRLRMEGTVVS